MPVVKTIPTPVTVVAVPIPPVGAYSRAGYCADSCASAATDSAPNDRTTHSALRERIC